MATVNTVSTLSGLFKSVYSDTLINLQPDNAVLQKLVKFKESEKIGKSYEVPVILSSEQGVTYAAAGDGAVSLNSSVAATLKNAAVDGSQIFLRGQIDYEAAQKAAGSARAFRNATELLLENLMDSGSRRLEIAMTYGQSGLATVSALASQVITITTGQFAAGIWAGMENAVIDVYQGATGTVRQAGLVISSVDLDARTITVTGTTTGIVSGDTIYFKGAYGKECVGLNKIITNTGTLFGIDASAYALWAGSSYSAGSAALTMSKVLSAVSKAVAKGGLTEDVVLMVNPLTWSNLNSDQSALRQYVDKDSKSVNGFESIDYRGMNGKISVIANPIVKEGEAFVFPPKRIKRIGATEMTFKTPGRDDEIFLQVPDMNAYELRLYCNQSIFCEAPAKCVKITAIVNS